MRSDPFLKRFDAYFKTIRPQRPGRALRLSALKASDSAYGIDRAVKTDMDPADPSAWHDDPREDTKPEQREPPRTWRRGPLLAPRPAHSLIKEPTLTNLLDWHSHNIDRDPLFAHYSSAAAAVVAGVVFGLARGASTALLSAPGSRLTGFILATKTATPLYVTPFVLGTQLDCWSTVPEREAKRRGDMPPERWGDFAHDANVL